MHYRWLVAWDVFFTEAAEAWLDALGETTSIA